MTDEFIFISENDLTPRELKASLADGTLRAWRPGPDGMWYQRVPQIHGVTEEGLEAELVEEVEDLEVDEEEEIEFIEADDQEDGDDD